MTNNPMYIVQELHALLFSEIASNELYSMELHSKSHHKAFHFHQHFYYILQVIYQLFYFYTYSFYSLRILLCHMIYHIRTRNY